MYILKTRDKEGWGRCFCSYANTDARTITCTGEMYAQEIRSKKDAKKLKKFLDKYHGGYKWEIAKPKKSEGVKLLNPEKALGFKKIVSQLIESKSHQQEASDGG